MKEKQHIFLASPHMSEEGYEQGYVNEAFETNWIAPLGKNVNEFENEMKAVTGARAAVALSAGTAALHMALRLAGVSKGDVVFCSTLTFSASANPIIYQGGIPVFIDSEESTWNMSPEALEKAFKKYEALDKLPKAVVVVHLYGMAAQMEPIMKLCRKYNCILIEDAAESLGTTYTFRENVMGPDGTEIAVGETRHLGTLGDYGILSFNGNKIITTSGGGMLLCNTCAADEDAKKALKWATQSRDNAPWYQHTELGYNYRMSNVVAGIGRGQLKVLDRRVEKKREIYEFYKNELNSIEEISLMPMQEHVYSNCWLTSVRLDKKSKVRPMTIIDALQKDDVESRPVWKPMHLQPYFAQYDFVSQAADRFTVKDGVMGADDSVAGQIFASGVCLPSDTKMDVEDMQRIVDVMKAVL